MDDALTLISSITLDLLAKILLVNSIDVTALNIATHVTP